MRRLVALLLALAIAGCVRQVVLSPLPDAGVPDADADPDGDTPPDGGTPDAFVPDGNGILPDAAVGG
jgi:hypothetical protein